MKSVRQKDSSVSLTNVSDSSVCSVGKSPTTSIGTRFLRTNTRELFNLSKYKRGQLGPVLKQNDLNSNLTVQLDSCAKKVNLFRTVFMDRLPRYINIKKKPPSAKSDKDFSTNGSLTFRKPNVFDRLEIDIAKRRKNWLSVRH